MMAREFTSERINEVINHPSVLPHVVLAHETKLDVSELVSDQQNVLLMNEAGTGGLLFLKQEPGIYEVHTQFLPEVRGPEALAQTREALKWMFLTTDCMELLTKVPADNIPAEALVKRIGGTLDFARDQAWGEKAVKFYALRFPDWIKTAEGLIERGVWFHNRLEAEKIKLGSKAEVHGDDSAHDRWVGLAIELIFRNQLAKALVLYNRWARFAGYSEVGVAKLQPLVIDIQEALLKVDLERQDFEVIMLCQ